MNKIKKIYSLTDIKYPWLLLISMLGFILALYFNRAYPYAFTRIEIVIYGAVFLVALLWSILNYVGHLKISAIYKRHDNIEVFIRGLTMNNEEKADLTEYINDFVKDLEENGSTHEEAVRTAISHFQVKEFTQWQGNIFETPIHYYLLGYVSIFAGLIIVIQCIDLIVSLPFIILAVSFMLMLFSAAFICLFFIYKLMDVMIAKK
ncbi:hypothetical protein OXPF_35870 [Oxobacter pfennigii]|uniref:Uncharacterized protein n=1 Tax=Oxobacter pfennigii TaxID=36849 RepID=A0A0N8NSS2_9CLOT|nr:hypothetical protein [Oxobacter pfennigii]KPU42824.1 hypothetical protein OXPF_35870 [Oxobacter pfennigii]